MIINQETLAKLAQSYRESFARAHVWGPWDRAVPIAPDKRSLSELFADVMRSNAIREAARAEMPL